MTASRPRNRDFTDNLSSHLPLVFGFVLFAAFLLLLTTFRSLVIPIKAIVLNLLSVGAAYGILVMVFQKGWGEGLLGFKSDGAIAAWLPLFLFVILFGLSMDYHVFILSRVREAYDGGMSTENAVAHAIKNTAGVVTSAALVMVGVFATFATLNDLPLKEMGVGLGAAVLIDATIIRGVLLPASMKLLGDRNWWMPRSLSWLPTISAEGSAPALKTAALRAPPAVAETRAGIWLVDRPPTDSIHKRGTQCAPRLRLGRRRLWFRLNGIWGGGRLELQRVPTPVSRAVRPGRVSAYPDANPKSLGTPCSGPSQDKRPGSLEPGLRLSCRRVLRLRALGLRRVWLLGLALAAWPCWPSGHRRR